MIKIKYVLIIIFWIIVSGCKENETKIENTDPSSKNKTAVVPITQSYFKGMYVSPETFIECGSHKKFIVSPDGDNGELEKALTSLNLKKPNQKLYIETEGFSSAREKSKGKGFDTILVITRFIKLDTALNCDN